MKKTMCKILTLALAAMMICTNAFAAIEIGDVTYDAAGDIATIPVSGLTGGSEVAVLVVENGVALDNADLADSIVYIDQVTLGAEATTLTVEGVKAKLRTLDEAYDKVDIYVGQSGATGDAVSKTAVKLSNLVEVAYGWSTAPTLAVQAGKASQIDGAAIAAAITKTEDGAPVAFTADASKITLTVTQADSVVAGNENKTVAEINAWIASLDAAQSDLSVAVKYDGKPVGAALALNIAAPAAIESITAAVAAGTEVPVNVLADAAALKNFLASKVTVTGNYDDESTAPITGWTVAAVTDAEAGDTVELTISFGAFTDTIQVTAAAEATAVGIAGKVVNKANAPLMGAAVSVIKLGSTEGTDVYTTDIYGAFTAADGTFQVEVPAGDYIVVVNYDGFRALAAAARQMQYYATYTSAKITVAEEMVTLADNIVMSRTYKEDINGDGVVNATDKNAVMGSTVWYKPAYTD